MVNNTHNKTSGRMKTQKPTNTENKPCLCMTLDADVVRAIDERRQRENRSSYVNYTLRNALGLEN